MTTLALIPARSGSKGVVGKNTRLLAGRPLLAWAIKIGLETCDWTFVTTDDPNIGLLAAQYGANIIIRPPYLATDEAPMAPVLTHAVNALREVLKPDVVVLLQPTQPLRTTRHVLEGLAMLTDEWDSVVSGVEVPARWVMSETVVGERLYPSYGGINRQQAGRRVVRDGTFYISRVETIERGTMYGNCRIYVVPESESCNIDTEEDFLRAEQMMKVRAIEWPTMN